ncbi:Aste57867_21239 [Aphanomyces stellatus]|uniref:Aste57867_21239 protein n=1 Tax=Aphanomyces stellatus TaxID=120398 RepID=A0A485LIA2_9STRA|nr:hypothetical protein As57867_021171 [Aphanomyces stellatus]VFT97911.1 Aste57867_21239 [Aphanomyces stellatus]
MSHSTSSHHRPYSEKKAALAEWTRQKETGITKVQFSRSRGTAISTFEKWCAKGDAIAGVEDGNIKHISGNLGKQRGAYKKRRPTNDKEAELYDWVQQAPKPIDKAAMRKKALELWPEYRDETSPLCKTPGNFRKFCLRLADRFTSTPLEPPTSHPAYTAAIPVNIATANPTTANLVANQAVNQAANPVDNSVTNPADSLAANPITDPVDNSGTDPATDPVANPITNHATDLTINPVANPTANPAVNPVANPITNHATDLTINPVANPTANPAVNPVANPAQNPQYVAADPLVFTTLYNHIEENQVVEGRTQPTRLAKGSHGKSYNSGVHSQACSHCSRRSPCDDFSVCQNLMVYTECSSGRCRAGKYCKNMMIQTKSYPKTTVVVDPVFGFGLRLEEDVTMYSKIIEYVGERITNDEYKKRLAAGLKSQTPLYLAQIANDAPLFVDAQNMGNESRFINHSCAPNCRFETWYVDKKPRLMVVAKSAMKRGTILSIFYIDPSWGIVCQCGVCDGTFLAPDSD